MDYLRVALDMVGRLHPLVLHLPIGLLIALAAVEFVALVRGSSTVAEARRVLAWLAAGSAVVAALSGLMLAQEDGYGGDTLEWHRWLGIGLGAACLLAAVVGGRLRLGRARTALYRLVLLAALVLMVPAGHNGATMTHGEGFLTAPLREARRAGPNRWTPDPEPGAASVFATTIQPIFASRCVNCHSETKRKGGLALHTAEALFEGGETGPAVVAGDAPGSELVYRLRLPLDHDDHMPPEGKPQLTEEAIAVIEAWIAAGAPFTPGEPAASVPPAGDAADARAPPPAPAPDAAAIVALRDALVHVQPDASEPGGLWVDFAAPGPAVTDENVQMLLGPLLGHITDLSLARCEITDESMRLAATMPRLRRLDVRGTPITDAGLQHFRGHAALRELVVVRTRVSDAGVDHLLAMPALERVYLWGAAVGAEAMGRLRVLRPTVTVDAGDKPDATALEREPEIKLTSDAPPVDAPPAAVALTPVNTVCPVTGSPLDPRFSIVFEGRVVGFCCSNCPKEFWEEPEKFRANIR